jgi:predicted component of type VI protein secretion system
MSITVPHDSSAPGSGQPVRRAVGGLRVLGTRRLHLFAEIRYQRFPKVHVTVGRAAQRDIRIRHPSVSRHHCTIMRTDDGYVLADHDSRNRVQVREPTQGGGFRRVFHALLVVGMQIRLGPVTLLVTDAQGRCPITAERGSEFCRRAVATYGSTRAAARNTGLPRDLFGRLVPPPEEGAR